MRIKTLIIVLAALSLSLVSCRKEEFNDYNFTMDTVVLNVKTSDWAYSNDNNNNFFYATFDMPEITRDVFENGLVKMYRVYDFNSTDAVQMEMPFTRHYEENVGDDEWVFYTESLDYEFGVGQISIYYTLSDFYYEIDTTISPDEMQFRCVIMN